MIDVRQRVRTTSNGKNGQEEALCILIYVMLSLSYVGTRGLGRERGKSIWRGIARRGNIKLDTTKRGERGMPERMLGWWRKGALRACQVAAHRSGRARGRGRSGAGVLFRSGDLGGGGGKGDLLVGVLGRGHDDRLGVFEHDLVVGALWELDGAGRAAADGAEDYDGEDVEHAQEDADSAAWGHEVGIFRRRGVRGVTTCC